MSDPATPSPLRPLLARPRGFRAVRAAYRTAQRGTVGVRRRYYLDGRGRTVIERLPRPIRAGLGLDDESAIGSRRIEIGGGPHAQAGYLHVDIDPGAHHLEWKAAAWELPLPDDWATEIVAVHALEHVEPARLVQTLTEWRRVLVPGGRVQVHVPNGPALFAAFVAAPVEEKWPIMGSLLGMYCGPGVRDPRGLSLRSDHQLILDEPLLRWSLEAAGLTDVRELTHVNDRHDDGWRELVPHYSLIAEARKPASAKVATPARG
jgi:SAM-dependent methyltransferase